MKNSALAALVLSLCFLAACTQNGTGGDSNPAENLGVRRDTLKKDSIKYRPAIAPSDTASPKPLR